MEKRSDTKMENIRNFSIIAHIDHGKSTLSDRFIEITEKIDLKKEKKKRVLDTLELEQEKGITIKLQATRMDYKDHVLNLIDTPGHVDFSYEVSRSLKACEGAILLVDASQGVQAQTLSTTRKALEQNLEIIPVLNKIDLPNVDVEARKKEMCEIMGFKEDEILLASAKTGKGATEILDAIIEKVPPPEGDPDAPLKALIFDSFYNEHQGVIASIRIFEGTLTPEKKLWLLREGSSFDPKEIGFYKPGMQPNQEISAGEVGYIATGLKDIKLFTVGDTISDEPKTEPLKGYKPPKSRVFATLFSSDPDDFPELSDSLTKLSMNDASLKVSPQRSNLLGSGFRCGFLGQLHMEIIQERLEREYGVSLVITTPSVEYEVIKTDGEKLRIQTAGEFPDPSHIQIAKEPWVSVEIFTPQEHIGPVMQLCENNRGEYKDTEYITHTHEFSLNYVILKYDLPLGSLVTGFFDHLKSISHGYATLDYEPAGYREADVVKVSVLVNKDEVPPLSFLEIRDRAESRSRKILATLKETIPRHQFKIALQAAIGSKIIAREDISALRKDVTAKLYGGDVTRKKKLLEKQKEGKKRLREVSGVNIPQEAFMAVLKS